MSLMGAGGVSGLAVGCGSAGLDESQSGNPPVFGAMDPSSGQTLGPGNDGSSGSSGSTPSQLPEGMMPGGPLSPTTENSMSPIAGACTPNQASCDGNILNRCNAEGTQITPEDCAAAGGTCGMSSAGPACLTQGCTPGQVSCEGANTVAICMADGSGFATTRCPNGTNCTGEGVCEPVRCNPEAMLSRNNGEATIYFFGQGTDTFGNIACRYGIDVGIDDGTNNVNNSQNGVGDSVNGIPNPEFFGAIATANFQNASACGACAELRYQNRSVTITIADECPLNNDNPADIDNPTCTDGHIDLSRAAWNALTDNAQGTEIGGVSWNFVPCDTAGNIEVELLDPGNIYWNEFVVRGHRYPIARAEVQQEDGTWVEAARQDYNAFYTPDHLMGTFRIRLTDVNGAMLEEQLDVNQAGFQPGEGQFDCQP